MSWRAPLFVVAILFLGAEVRAAEPKARTFTGHTGAINAVAVTADGKLIASTGADGTVKVWDNLKGKELYQLPGASSGWSVAFSPDGTKLAVAAGDQTVRVFDMATGKQVRSCEGHQMVVWAVAFSPDGKTIASASQDGTVRIWDAAKGKEERQLTGPSAPWTIAFSSDGRTFAIGFDNGSVHLWDARRWREGKQWDGAEDGGIWPIAMSPDGRTVATVKWQNGTVKLWEAATGQLRDSFTGAAGGGWAVAFTGDGCTVLGVGPAGVTLFDAWSGQKATLNEKLMLYSAACSADGRTLVAGDANGGVHVWDIRDLRKELRPKATKLTEQELNDHWAVLTEANGETAFRSLRALAAAPSQTVALMRERLKPIKAENVDEAAVAKLIALLDDDDFEKREKASAELEKLGPKIAPLLRTMVKKTKSAEVRRRLGARVDRWSKTPLTAEEMRALRAIEVLEAIGTAEAREVLKKLGEGADESPLTLEAKASLGRMGL